MAEIAVGRETRSRTLDLRAAVWAGLISGAVFVMLEMLMVPLFLDGSPWGPPRMIAAIALGEGVLPPPATFDLGILVAAMVVHFALSVLYAIALAVVVERVGFGLALAIGTGFGLLLYVVNFYGFTAVFPWFAMARNWVSVFAHAVFGLVAAWAYVALTREGRPVER